MWLPDLADPVRVADVLSRHAERLDLRGAVAAVELVDVRLTHPHRPGSPLCRGWATYRVTTSDAEPVLLYLKGFPDPATSEAASQQDRTARPRGQRHHLAGEVEPLGVAGQHVRDTDGIGQVRKPHASSSRRRSRTTQGASPLPPSWS